MKQKSREFLTRKVCENVLTVPPYPIYSKNSVVPESLFSLPTFLSPKLLGIKENAYTDVNTTDLTALLFGPPLVFQTHKNSRFRCKNIRGLAAPERFFSFSLYFRPSYRILPDDTRG